MYINIRTIYDTITYNEQGASDGGYDRRPGRRRGAPVCIVSKSPLVDKLAIFLYNIGMRSDYYKHVHQKENVLLGS